MSPTRRPPVNRERHARLVAAAHRRAVKRDDVAGRLEVELLDGVQARPLS